jgi:hypothetical protein
MAIYLLRRVRPVIPGKRIVPFAAILLFAAIVVGYPLLVYGFNWLSYGNDDMMNYCLGAKLFLNQGHFSAPPAEALITDRDASLFYWFFLVVHAIRHGAEELLAWASGTTGLSAHQAYMPFILALNLSLIASAAALVMQGKRSRSAALLTSFALALSALTALGTIYQLLAQVAGLGTMVGATTVLLRPLAFTPKRALFIGLLASGAAIIYPELLPFLALSFLLYHSMAVIRKKESLRPFLKSVGVMALCAVVLLNTSLFVVLFTIVMQMGATLGNIDISGSLFPYFMTPGAFAYLWGFLAIAQRETGPLVDVGAILGAILFVIAMAAAVRYVWKGRPVAYTLLVMEIAALQLFRMRSDFGLYKIAMYIQPFLLGTMSILLISAFRRWHGRSRRIILAAVACSVIAWGSVSQVHYTMLSLGRRAGGGFVEIPAASEKRLISTLKQTFEGRPQTVVSATPTVIIAKLLAYYDGPVYFTAKDMFGGFLGRTTATDPWNPVYVGVAKAMMQVAKEREERFVPHVFDMHGDLPPNAFALPREISEGTSLSLAEDGIDTGVINRRLAAEPNEHELVRPTNSFRNYLMFVRSDLGATFDTAGRLRANGFVSMFQLEPDYFFANKTMASTGRVSLFRILNPSGQFRVYVEYTASLNSDGHNYIPAADAIGSQRVPFGAIGRGSAHLISPLLEGQTIDDGQYVALDFGTWGQTFAPRRSAILRLWGRDVPSDSRRIVGFTRDISLISEQDYAALDAPHSIQWFPRDLTNKNLEYSGIYEDGWVAESSYVVLKAPQEFSTLAVSVSVPELRGRRAASWVALLVDGQEVGRQPASSATIGFRIPVRGSGKRRIELRFDRADSLPAPDGRPISALIRYVRFQRGDQNLAQENHAPENRSSR